MTTKRKGTRASVGSQIIRDLKKLNRVIANGESVCDRFTCNRVILKLEPRRYVPEMVKEVRKGLGMSQAIFAQFIGVTASCVRSWEQGKNPVPGMACRFMDELCQNKDHWRKRLSEVAVDKELLASD